MRLKLTHRARLT